MATNGQYCDETDITDRLPDLSIGSSSSNSMTSAQVLRLIRATESFVDASLEHKYQRVVSTTSRLFLVAGSSPGESLRLITSICADLTAFDIAKILQARYGKPIPEYIRFGYEQSLSRLKDLAMQNGSITLDIDNITDAQRRDSLKTSSFEDIAGDNIFVGRETTDWEAENDIDDTWKPDRELI